jgi:glutaredoxin-related protein
MIKFYTTHCPKCEILKKKLDNKEIKYEEIDDEKLMIEKGFMFAPMIEVNEEIMDFIKAVKWVNAQ